MKKITSLFLTALMLFCILAFAGCSSSSNPGTPPENVVNPGNSQSAGGNTDGIGSSDDAAAFDGSTLENAVSIRIGQGGQDERAVDMINNPAVNTMLGYLTGEATLFPSSIYEGDAGYVAHNIRGSYTRDDEVTIVDVHAGELYLFSDGQLRLYFKDATGANITATPVGVLADTTNLTTEVEADHAANTNDPWNVEVYFWITKNI